MSVVTEHRRGWWVSADRAELERRASETEELGPFLELARAIRQDVARVVADDRADAAAITEAIERVPREERERVVREVFDRLPAEAQWSVLERAFGDDEIRQHLSRERDERLARLRADETARAAAHEARLRRSLDTAALPVGIDLTLGLFREGDVRAAVERGAASSSCARRLVLRCVEPGWFQLLDDVFNPGGGYFVTAEYDERTWEGERLDPHALVRIGSDAAGGSFQTRIYPGGRLDVEVDGAVSRSELHVGFVVLDDVEVFAG